MTDDVSVGGVREGDDEDDSRRRFTPIRVGEATVWVEQASDAIVEPTDEIHPVAPPDPQQAFENAGSFLRECVRIFDERIRQLEHRPEEISVEFSLGFELRGKATLIPVFLTGESSLTSGIKVTAIWKPGQSGRPAAATDDPTGS
jgi:hypothetical protein